MKSVKSSGGGGETAAKSTTTSNKCFPCKKLPIVQRSQTTLNIQNRTTGPNDCPPCQPRIVITPASNTNMGQVSASNHQNQTYCSSRRSVSAKLKASRSFQQYRPSLAMADTDIMQHDMEFVAGRKTDVNKEEQMRRMNIIPGRTFRSQRAKSISVEHVPPSRKKLDTQTRRVLLTTKSSDVKLPVAGAINGETRTGTGTDSDTLVDLHAETGSISRPGVQRSRNLALAFQHHEEIFSLVRNKDKSGQIKLDLANQSTEYLGGFTTPSSNDKLDEFSNVFYRANSFSMCSSDHNEKRPKTSKV